MSVTSIARYYAHLTERIPRFSNTETVTRLIAFESLEQWPEALARNVDPRQVVSLVFTDNYRKPAGEEAELFT